MAINLIKIESTPDMVEQVYASLLDLVERTSHELSDLQPRDRIDIQSFIWVVGEYQEDRDGTYA
jgi:hypothetical protein